MIYAQQRFSRMNDLEVAGTGDMLCDQLDGNRYFTKLPFDLAKLKAEVATFRTLIAAARDGSRTIIAQRNKQRAEVIRLMRLLVRYVENASDDDMDAFRTSGLKPAYQNRRPQEQLSEMIRRIVLGPNSGKVRIFIKAYPRAAVYQLRWAQIIGEDPPTNWTVKETITNVKSATVLDLIPAKRYAIQCRALVDGNYTDWTDSVTFMCT
jgi:hypothetical protein